MLLVDLAEGISNSVIIILFTDFTSIGCNIHTKYITYPKIDTFLYFNNIFEMLYLHFILNSVVGLMPTPEYY